MGVVDHLTRMLARIDKDPEDAHAYEEAGVCLYELREPVLAEHFMEAAHEISPQEPDILYNYSSLLYSNMNLDQALSMYNSFIERCPEEKEARKRRVELSYLLGVPVNEMDLRKGGILDEEL